LTACTAEDGNPWGYAEAELTVEEPTVGTAFEVESFELEVNTVRLITTSTTSAGSGEFDPQNPPPGCNLCHGGHCHCDGELISYEDLRAQVASGGGTSQRVVANIDPSEAITSAGTVSLGDASIGERLALDTVELELAGLRVDGTLTRDGQEIPTTMSLPGIAGMKFSAPATIAFGPDAPEMQSMNIALDWRDDWLQVVNIDELETGDSGEIVIASTSNRGPAEAIVAAIANSSIAVEVHSE
jgi:hypothetical protein